MLKEIMFVPDMEEKRIRLRRLLNDDKFILTYDYIETYIAPVMKIYSIEKDKNVSCPMVNKDFLLSDNEIMIRIINPILEVLKSS